MTPTQSPSDREELIQAACELVSPSCKDLSAANEILIKSGYEPSSESRLAFALKKNLLNTIPWLVLDGEDINQRVSSAGYSTKALTYKMSVLTCLSFLKPKIATSLFEFFLKLGADQSIVDELGYTVLESLCYSKPAKVKLFKLLLKNGADVNFQIHKAQNLSILAFCLYTPHLYKFAQCLLDAGANPNQPNNVGRQPMVYFLENLYKNKNNLPQIESLFLSLIEKGADLDRGNYSEDFEKRNSRFVLDNSKGADVEHLRTVYTLYERDKMAEKVPSRSSDYKKSPTLRL